MDQIHYFRPGLKNTKMNHLPFLTFESTWFSFAEMHEVAMTHDTYKLLNWTNFCVTITP